MKSLSLSKYFEIVRPEYIFLKLTPVKSLRNYSSDKIIAAVAGLYKSLTQRIVRQNRKYFFSVPVKVSYYIYMERDKAEFYFVIPKDYQSLLRDKIRDTWRNIAIDEVSEVPFFSATATKYSLTYEKEDAFSLHTDKRNNALLSSIMSVMSVLEDGDRVGVVYNFMPYSQRYWRGDYDYYLKKYADGYPIEREKSTKYLVKLMLKALIDLAESFMQVIAEFGGARTKPARLMKRSTDSLQNDTLQKRNHKVVGTQIVVFSDSADKKRANNNALSVCQSFGVLKLDNDLIYKRIGKGAVSLTDYKLKGADTIITSALESQNFVSLPAKEIIEEHKLPCVDVTESDVIPELRTGVAYLGESTYRGAKSPVYLSNDFELRNLTHVINGANRSGKSTLVENLIKNYLDNGECVILADYCGICEMTQKMPELFPARCKVIDCSNLDELQGLGFNEVYTDSQNEFERYRTAKMQTTQLTTFINCVNEEDRALKAKMDRFLEAACMVTFLTGGQSLKQVIDVLTSHKVRQRRVSEIPASFLMRMESYIMTLDELNETNSNGESVGTKYHIIAGIIDRVNVLKKNTYIELMYEEPCERNINLVEEIQKNQIICLRMPEEMFATPIEKDVFVTYWCLKIWLALQLRYHNIRDRKEHRKVNIIIDELYQVERCQAFIAGKLSQMPKFTAKLTTTCHYLSQLTGIKQELKATNAAYTIIQGSNVSCFNELKSEFENLGYAQEDLLNLKRYHALHLLSSPKGYWAGVTKLPPPLK